MSVYQTDIFTPTNQRRSRLPGLVQDELWAAEQVRAVVYALERAMALPLVRMGREVDMALRMIAQLRETIEEWLPGEKQAWEAEKLSIALDRLKRAQTLMSGLDYPGFGARRKPVERASEVLQNILADGLL